MQISTKTLLRTKPSSQTPGSSSSSSSLEQETTILLAHTEAQRHPKPTPENKIHKSIFIYVCIYLFSFVLNFSVLFCFEFFFFLVLWVPTDTYIVFCGFVFFPGCVAFCFFSLFFFGRFFECISFVMIFCVFFWLFLCPRILAPRSSPPSPWQVRGQNQPNPTHSLVRMAGAPLLEHSGGACEKRKEHGRSTA